MQQLRNHQMSCSGTFAVPHMDIAFDQTSRQYDRLVGPIGPVDRGRPCRQSLQSERLGDLWAHKPAAMAQQLQADTAYQGHRGKFPHGLKCSAAQCVDPRVNAEGERRASQALTTSGLNVRHPYRLSIHPDQLQRFVMASPSPPPDACQFWQKAQRCQKDAPWVPCSTAYGAMRNTGASTATLVPQVPVLPGYMVVQAGAFDICIMVSSHTTRKGIG
jgi:hypothetical protein